MPNLRTPNILIALGAGLLLLSVAAGLVQGEIFNPVLLIGVVVIISGLYQRMTLKSGGQPLKAWPLGLYALVWIAFTFLRAYADDIGMPDQGELAAWIDRLMGFGTTPTERLQHWLYTPGEVGFIDRFALFIHVSYFGVPHFLAIALWLHRSPRIAGHFASYLRMTAMVLGFGLLLYALLPTSPPWLQGGSYGSLELERLVWAVHANDAAPNEQVYGVVTDPNPIAAMPSLHTAITVLVAFVAWRVNRWLGIIAAAYAFIMGLSLVYMGEHFVIDVIAGLALTIGVVALERRYVSRWAWFRNFGMPRQFAPSAAQPAMMATPRTKPEQPGRSVRSS